MKRFKMPESMRVASIWVVWGVLAIGALGWALFVVLDFFGVQSQAAAWVQAVGSIAAIGAAIGIANYQHVKDERKSRADSLWKHYGFSLRLYYCVKEIHEILKEISPDKYFPGVENIDQKNAAVLSMLRDRLNNHFNDDLDQTRLSLVSAERQLLNACIFLFQQASVGIQYENTRDIQLSAYRTISRTNFKNSRKIAIFWGRRLKAQLSIKKLL